MGTRFNSVQKSIFNAKDGAYSVVTSKDEDTKGQITITENETDIFENWFGVPNIHIGPANSNPVKSTKTFFIANSQKTANLKLVYPKAHKPELRLYMNQGQGFRPHAGDVWFVCEPNNGANLVLGWMSASQWENLGSKDDNDEEYQEVIQLPAPPQAVISTTKGYARNRSVAMNRMTAAGFMCEADPAHVTFISPVTGENFVEPHHLIPMAGQPDFQVSLDIEENIAVLCPNCHKAIHLAGRDDKLRLLKHFYTKHAALLAGKSINISFEDLIAYYNL